MLILKLLIIVFLSPILLSAASTNCNNIYFGGEAPDIINAKLLNKAGEKCYSEFAIMHSGEAKSALWSGEHLIASQLNVKIERTNDFRAEMRLPADERGELEDWRGQNMDRGHLANARDMHTEQGEHDSFFLSNMIAQEDQYLKVGFSFRF